MPYHYNNIKSVVYKGMNALHFVSRRRLSLFRWLFILFLDHFIKIGYMNYQKEIQKTCPDVAYKTKPFEMTFHVNSSII